MGKIIIVDLAACNGCHTAKISCKDEHVANDWSPMPAPADTAVLDQGPRHRRGTVPR